MGPTMPPSKKAQSPSSGASASQGMSPPYRQGDAATAASEAEGADLSLSVSASFSKAEDEELTSLSWLHESTDLLNSFSHSGLRSVSPLQDPDGQQTRSPSSSPSLDDPLLGDAHSPYDLTAGANRKPPYSFSCLIFMAIEDAPNKRLPVKDIYGWILEHFPYFANAPTGWKNSVRHNLSLNKCFKKVDKDRSQSIGKGSLWSIDPEYRHNLIQALKKTPYHPYSTGLAAASTSPPSLPQAFYHSPPLWSGSPLFRKNGGVLLQGTVTPSALSMDRIISFFERLLPSITSIFHIIPRLSSSSSHRPPPWWLDSSLNGHSIPIREHSGSSLGRRALNGGGNGYIRRLRRALHRY